METALRMLPLCLVIVTISWSQLTRSFPRKACLRGTFLRMRHTKVSSTVAVTKVTPNILFKNTNEYTDEWMSM